MMADHQWCYLLQVYAAHRDDDGHLIEMIYGPDDDNLASEFTYGTEAELRAQLSTFLSEIREEHAGKNIRMLAFIPFEVGMGGVRITDIVDPNVATDVLEHNALDGATIRVKVKNQDGSLAEHLWFTIEQVRIP